MDKKFNKKMLIPILTFVALLLKQIFNIDVPDQIVDIAADLIMFAVAAIGFKLHPHVTEPTQEVQTNATQEPTTVIENNR